MQPTGGCHFRTCSVWPDTAVRIPQWFIVQWTSIRLKRSTGCIWHRKSLSLYGGCDTRLSRVCLLCLWGWCVGASERHDEPEQNKNFGNLTFAQDADGNWGYKVGGADPVIPFKQGGVKLLTSITGDGAINITSYVTTDYKKLTVDNFIVESYYFPKAQTVNTSGGNRSAGAALGATLSKSYDQSTGILTVSGLSQLACLMDNTTNVRASVIQKFSAKIYMVN